MRATEKLSEEESQMFLKGRVKFIVLLFALLSVVATFGCSYFQKGSGGSSSGGGGGLGRPLRVGIVTWPGYAGGIVANNGFKPNEDCIYFNKYGLKVEFLLMEDIDVRNKAFAKGGEDGVDIVWSTVDFWANELPGFLKDNVKARAIMQVDWSRGGDAIVADSSIKKIEDLKGKTVSLATQTPSDWLLEYSLENSSLDDSDKSDITHRLVGTTASPDARANFVARKVDAAVVWEPDVSEALSKRPGSHILLSSRDAANLIADLMVAREDFIKEHPDVIKSFIQGWMDGTQEANKNPDKVVRLLMDNEPVYKELGDQGTRASLPTVKWADMTDNTQMFGLDGSEPLFDRIFKQASQAWVKRSYIIGAPTTPEQAKDVSFLKEIYAASPVSAATGPKLKPASEEIENKEATMSKPVNIYFGSGKSDLDTNAQQLLDPVVTLAQTMSGAYIRIEGNTDNVGSADANRKLSDMRAQAVVDYLVQHYKLDKSRFVIKGNGPDKPVKPNTTDEGRSANRRTEVQIVSAK
jgi:NitT/TauT family transport system substrate-binding protein